MAPQPIHIGVGAQASVVALLHSVGSFDDFQIELLKALYKKKVSESLFVYIFTLPKNVNNK